MKETTKRERKTKKKKEEKSIKILTKKILTTNEFIQDDNSLMRCRLKTIFISDLSKNASFKNHPRTKVAVSSFKPACSIIFTIVAHFISVFCSRQHQFVKRKHALKLVKLQRRIKSRISDQLLILPSYILHTRYNKIHIYNITLTIVDST